MKSIVVAALILMAVSGSTVGQTAPIIVLPDAVVGLAEGASTQRDSMILEASGLTAEQMTADLVVRDLDVPSGPHVVAIGLRELEAGSSRNGRRWLLTVEASGLDDALDQQRYLGIELADIRATRSYQLVNEVKGTFAWKVSGPHADVSLRPGGAIDIGVAVLGRPATGVRLMQADLVENSTHAMVVGGWRLCPIEGVCTGDGSLALDADSSTRLRLIPASQFVGKYTGKVVIGAHEDPEGETLTFTVYGTDPVLQWLGVLTVLAGVVGAWISSTWAQNRINRAELLRPLVAVGDRAAALRSRLDRLATATSASLTHEELGKLATAALIGRFEAQGLLPPVLPLPRASTEGQLERYRRELDAIAERCQILELVVRRGYEKLDMQPGIDPVQIADAVRSLDEASMAKTLDAAVVLVTAALKPFVAALEMSSAQGPSPTAETLALQIRKNSILVWSVFLVLSTALGAHVIIVQNPGFGLPSDFLICLFWGFGLPVTAQQLGQATIANAGRALNVPVPKSMG